MNFLQRVTVSGWGKTSNGSFPYILREVDLPVISNMACSDAFGTLIQPTHVCAGKITEIDGSCSGDSGGPVVWTDSKQRGYQIGVVNFGALTCETGIEPNAFARVTEYLDWILNNTGKVLLISGGSSTRPGYDSRTQLFSYESICMKI